MVAQHCNDDWRDLIRTISIVISLLVLLLIFFELTKNREEILKFWIAVRYDFISNLGSTIV